jgi:hypothetical protein
MRPPHNFLRHTAPPSLVLSLLLSFALLSAFLDKYAPARLSRLHDD